MLNVNIVREIKNDFDLILEESVNRCDDIFQTIERLGFELDSSIHHNSPLEQVVINKRNCLIELTKNDGIYNLYIKIKSALNNLGYFKINQQTLNNEGELKVIESSLFEFEKILNTKNTDRLNSDTLHINDHYDSGYEEKRLSLLNSFNQLKAKHLL